MKYLNLLLCVVTIGLLTSCGGYDGIADSSQTLLQMKEANFNVQNIKKLNLTSDKINGSKVSLGSQGITLRLIGEGDSYQQVNGQHIFTEQALTLEGGSIGNASVSESYEEGEAPNTVAVTFGSEADKIMSFEFQPVLPNLYLKDSDLSYTEKQAILRKFAITRIPVNDEGFVQNKKREYLERKNGKLYFVPVQKPSDVGMYRLKPLAFSELPRDQGFFENKDGYGLSKNKKLLVKELSRNEIYELTSMLTLDKMRYYIDPTKNIVDKGSWGTVQKTTQKGSKSNNNN